MRKHLVPVIHHDTKHRVGQRFLNNAFNFDQVFSRHIFPASVIAAITNDAGLFNFHDGWLTEFFNRNAIKP